MTEIIFLYSSLSIFLMHRSQEFSATLDIPLELIIQFYLANDPILLLNPHRIILVLYIPQYLDHRKNNQFWF